MTTKGCIAGSSDSNLGLGLPKPSACCRLGSLWAWLFPSGAMLWVGEGQGTKASEAEEDGKRQGCGMAGVWPPQLWQHGVGTSSPEIPRDEPRSPNSGCGMGNQWPWPLPR